MKKLSLLLLATIVLGGCKKNDDNSPAAPTQSKTDLLTAKSWRVSTISATLNGTQVPSSLFFQDCDKDDKYTFKTDKTLVADAGALKCDPTDPQQESGTWAFSNTDQTKLTLSLPNSVLSGDADIKELTANTLHLYGTQAASGVTYTLDATFVPY